MKRTILRGAVFVPVLVGMLAIGPHYSAAQQRLDITVENLQATDGFFLTPIWIGVHNGSFDSFDAGSFASSSLESLAEEGNVSGLQSDFAASASGGSQSVIFGPSGFGGAPVTDPGEIATQRILINDTTNNRFFSYASMVIPSNDAFIGNDNALAYSIFDAGGNFAGPITIDIFGADVWDAGTEVNDAFGGAAFSANGGTSVSENLLIQVHPGLDKFLGTDTVAGTTINSSLGLGTHLARITISAVPEPGSLSILALAAIGLGVRLRRR